VRTLLGEYSSSSMGRVHGPLSNSLGPGPASASSRSRCDLFRAARRGRTYLSGMTSRCVLEAFTRCSDSLLWKLMMSFYDRKGVESWSQGIVPHFITCNAFIGRAYAKVLLGFLSDCSQASSKITLHRSHCLYIVELGAGSGKFSFFMLKVACKDT
jgi:hypothetical protein